LTRFFSILNYSTELELKTVFRQTWIVYFTCNKLLLRLR